MPIHLRGEKCALRGAFLRWMLFTALLTGASFLVLADKSFFPERYLPISLRFITYPMEQILIWPENLSFDLLDLYVPEFWRWTADGRWNMFQIALFVARFCAMFAWGVFRLRRGKRTPYAETLWLLVICAIALAVLEDLSFGIKFEIATLLHRRFGVPAALLTMTGIVVFVFQRRRPPTWKRKMPE